MTTYDKPKRKNTPRAQLSIFKMLSSIIGSLLYFGIVVPFRWMWLQLGRFLQWNWQLVRAIVGWTGRQIGTLLSGIWWLVRMILQKTVFAPLIAVGRLLGFVPNAIPDGLSAKESEVYQRINRQYRRRKRWYLHVIIFLISMVVVWTSYIAYYPFYANASAAMMVTLIWLMVLGTHRLWMHLGKSEDREIGEALQQLRQPHNPVYEETY